MVVDRAMLQREHGGGDWLLPEPTTLKLITMGRTTGLPHVAIVRFAVSGSSYFAMGAGRKSDWFLNAVASVFPFNRFGDQTLFVFQRKEQVPPEGDAWALDAGVGRTVFGKGTMR
jgi:hypothetical protein